MPKRSLLPLQLVQDAFQIFSTWRTLQLRSSVYFSNLTIVHKRIVLHMKMKGVFANLGDLEKALFERHLVEAEQLVVGLRRAL